MPRVHLLVASALWLAACGGGDGADAGRDAERPVDGDDAGMDAGLRDAGLGMDAAVRDAGLDGATDSGREGLDAAFDAGAGCVTGDDCGPTTCAMVPEGCVQSSPICADGACGSDSALFPRRICDPGVGQCRAPDGDPSDGGVTDAGPACTMDPECGTPACRQVGSACAQNTPRCAMGACRFEMRTLSGSTCDAGTGLCGAPVDGGGPIDGGFGCFSDADCAPPTCRQMGRDCTQSTTMCVGGICRPTLRTVAGSTCDSATGICGGAGIDAGPPPSPDGGLRCVRDSDCGSPACRQFGTDCVRSLPKCEMNRCGARIETMPGRTCDPVAGDCR